MTTTHDWDPLPGELAPTPDGGFIDASNPEALNSAAAAVTRSDQPTVQPPPDDEVTLPGGFVDADGRLHTVAKVRELTGADEEMLARFDGNNLGAMISAILDAALLTVGPHDADMSLIRSLLMGDRDAIILGIRRATYGNDIEMEITCPSEDCSAKSDVAIEIDKDIPVKQMEEPEKRTHTLDLRKGRKVTVRHATGGSQEAAFGDGKQKRTAAEMNTSFLMACIVEIDGFPVTEQSVRDMNLADRRKVLTWLGDSQPGPLYGEVKVPCSACKREFPLMLDVADLLRG